MTKTILTTMLVIILAVSVSGQNLLDLPESAAFDALNNRYLVSNAGDGAIIQIEADFVTQSYFQPSLGEFSLGNVITGDVFYTSVEGKYIKGFDLTTDQLVMDMTIMGAGNLDGMTADNSGNLYVVETARGMIFKIEISTQTYSTFTTGLGVSPQDLFYDETNDRILVCKYTADPSAIYSINMTDGIKTLVATSAIGRFDGITMDDQGNTYLASHLSGGGIYKYGPAFTEPPELIANYQIEPAGPDFNIRDNILAIPNFSGARVDFLSFNDVDEDGILDYQDNCPNTSNSGQEDDDGDGNGDVCDLCPGFNDNLDDDGDTVPNDCDVCPGFDDLTDTDEDGLADGCDNCPNDSNFGQEDGDVDEIGDICDNCPEHFNPGQEDINGNNVGDVCDYTCGDIDGTPEINILDIVFLINNVYKAGPDPDPLESADVNHDYLVNILDIVLLINNIYKDGPAPECVVWI
ncbi:MAG: hypothetical protein GY865_15185 [candidate division Zixibacteria bacterium]|nr:hypothetical protein [candidate division Zixibacteria bacterium]